MIRKSFIHGLSVVLATHNEAASIEKTLQSVKDIAREIVVVDGQSSDETPAIARRMGAIVVSVPNKKMFHINKELATKQATSEWILELDADEIITEELAREITSVVDGTHRELDLGDYKQFRRHMHNIEIRDGITYTSTPPIVGYFIARKNFFLGSYLMHSGVYPDGVIRLVKNGYATWPCKSVHEQMRVDGGVSWLKEPMIHMGDPTFKRYLARADRYTTLTADELFRTGVHASFTNSIRYFFILPLSTFILLFLRNKGFLDGVSGFVWALMSGLHHAIAYAKLLERVYK